jgi:flagellar basal body P-ring formation protein FlgA
MRKTFLALSLALVWANVATADTFVAADAITARIATAIAARLPTPGHYKVTLPEPGYQLPARYDIAALSFDPARQTFAATLGFQNAGGVTEYLRLNGTAFAVLDVPMLARDIAVGETIADADVMTMELPADRISGTLLTSRAGVAGQAARRQLRAQTPLYTYDLKKPVLVKKGDLVNITYALPGIELTAQGQAQADAGLGDTVAVLNTRSRRTIEGRVTGAGAVSVTTPGATLAANP